MDQPYSRIADALLDYQYWAPNDAQARPYDDTGWTFPEGFGVQAVRVTDVKVLEAPVELIVARAADGVVLERARELIDRIDRGVASVTSPAPDR